MSIEEIRQSGKLEYYVLGLLSETESLEVENWFVQFPELKSDLRAIELAMRSYAQENGIQPRASLEGEIISNIIDQETPVRSEHKDKSQSGKVSSIFAYGGFLLLGLIALMSTWYASNRNSDLEKLNDRLSSQEAACDSVKNQLQEEIELYREVSSPNYQGLRFTPTPGYKETDIKLYYNEKDAKNYLRISELPAIASNQAFQLWSLKDGVDPIPLTVFKGEDGLIALDFEEGTGTYAITIEAEGGALTPTLDRLIGTCSV